MGAVSREPRGGWKAVGEGYLLVGSGLCYLMLVVAIVEDERQACMGMGAWFRLMPLQNIYLRAINQIIPAHPN